jgi:hypothetical protein
MSNAANVSTAKPSVGGAIYSAPLGTTLPVDAVSKLDATFASLGYLSEDGLSNKDTPDSDVIKAWGGDQVEVVQKGKSDEFTYTLIEALNVDVLKEVYGPDNVSGTLDTLIKIKSNSSTLPPHVLVADIILKGGILKRVVIPNGRVTEIGEVKYGDEDAVGYETTLTAVNDGEGNSHYEYIQKPTTTAEVTGGTN